MTPENWKKLSAAFDHVVELEESDRAVYLADLAARDPRFHKSLLNLLAADDHDAAELVLPIGAKLEELAQMEREDPY